MKNNNKNRNMFASGILFVGLIAGVLTPSMAQKVVDSAPGGVGVYEMVINPNDGFIYTTGIGKRGQEGGALYKIDPGSLKITDSILLREDKPFGLALNTQSNIAYTSNTRSNSVSAIDLKTGKLLKTIPGPDTASHTREILVDEAKNIIYVTDVAEQSRIWIIDGNTQSLLGTIDNIGKFATGMAFSSDRDKIFVINMGENEIAVVDISAKKVEKKFSSGGLSPINLVRHKDALYVTNQKSNNVTVLSVEGTLLKTIPTGEGAIGIDYDAEKHRLYVGNRGAGTTTVIDANSYDVLADLKTGTYPNNVKVDAKTGNVFVLSKADTGGRNATVPKEDPNGDLLFKIK